MRFYDPTGGSIMLNGEDIRGFNLKSLRRTIGIVSQEPVLFSGTLAGNIAYGKKTATRAEITAAARKANCDFIQGLLVEMSNTHLYYLAKFVFSFCRFP